MRALRGPHESRLDGWLIGRTSEELRRTYVAWRFVPIARLVFRARPDVRSVTVAFSREDDGQVNAVYETFAASDLDSPPWVTDAASFPEHGAEDMAIRDIVSARGIPSLGDEWASFVVAFAPCCAPLDDTCSRPRPWAVARRGDDGLHPHVEIIGSVIQPELEDRWCIDAQSTELRALALDTRLSRDAARRERLLRATPSPCEMLDAARTILATRPFASDGELSPSQARQQARLQAILDRAEQLLHDLECDT